MSRPEGARARYGEQGNQNYAHEPTSPHAAPSKRKADQQVSPPSCAHFVESDAADDRIEPSMLSHQRVTSLPTHMKEAVRRVVDEPMHRIGAIDPVEGEIAEAGDAIRKGLQELPRRHVVVGEPFDQCRSAIFFGQSEFLDGDRVTHGPWAQHDCKSQTEA